MDEVARERARTLAARDQAWEALKDFQSQLESIYRNGISSEQDESLAKVCIAAVLGELNFRKAEFEDLDGIRS